MDGKMMADMNKNNCQHIGSNIMKRLQHIFVQETFSYCDRITDKTLPIIIVPHGKCSVRSSVRKPVGLCT